MYKTLVVEDNHDTRLLIVDLLDSYPQWSFEVFATDNPNEALEIAKKNPPDLAILDVQLGTKMTGFDIATWLRSNAMTCEAKIIILTALDDPADMHAGERAGADAYLVKPVEMRILQATLQDILA